MNVYIHVGDPFYVNVWIHLWSNHIHQLRFLSSSSEHICRNVY